MLETTDHVTAADRAAHTRPTRRRRPLVRLVTRPESTAAVGVVVVFAYFALTAGHRGFLSTTGTDNYLQVAGQIGLIASAVTLLMIAGEFDLSVGSMVGAGGIAVAYPVVYHHWPLWAALLVGCAVALLVGVIQGVIVVATGLPSFIVTLAGMFIIAGLNLEITNKLAQGGEIDGMNAVLAHDWLRPAFAGRVHGLSVDVFWWLGITALATWVMTRARLGNWIYACGGDRDAARRAGVPVKRVKVLLFVFTALMSTLVGVLIMFSVDAANINNGNGYEFQTITAAVIGGALLTGGFGSAIGTALGSLIYAMVGAGFFFTNIDGNWVEVFLGTMLLLAVAANHYARWFAIRSRGA
jgi:simple sugar transport system permease protein